FARRHQSPFTPIPPIPNPQSPIPNPLRYHRTRGRFRAAPVAAERPPHDALQLGEPALFSGAAAAGAALLRRRARRARRRRLPLAGGPVAAHDARRAARPERVERRALPARAPR